MCVGTVQCLPDRGSYTCISIMIMDKKCYCIYVDVFLRVGAWSEFKVGCEGRVGRGT